MESTSDLIHFVAFPRTLPVACSKLQLRSGLAFAFLGKLNARTQFWLCAEIQRESMEMSRQKAWRTRWNLWHHCSCPVQFRIAVEVVMSAGDEADIPSVTELSKAAQ